MTSDVFTIELARSNRANPIVHGFSAREDVVGGVACEWVNADETDGDDVVVLYFHGGAYLAGDAENSRAATVGLARAAAARVLVPNYRLGPEHPFPAAYEDAFSAYAGLLSSFDGEQRPVVLAGDSVGGALPVSVLIQARDEGLPMPLGLVLNSPVADMCARSASLVDPRYAHPQLTRERIRWLQETYLATADADPADVRWSPVYGDLTGLPPMLVQVAGRDPLHDDGVRLADRAGACGVEVTVTEYPESGHSWILRGTNPPDHHADAAIAEAADFIRTRVRESA